MMANSAVRLTDAHLGECVVVDATRVVAIMPWYALAAKPEDKPKGTLLVIPGIERGLLVKESLSYCRGEITKFWETDNGRA